MDRVLDGKTNGQRLVLGLIVGASAESRIAKFRDRQQKYLALSTDVRGHTGDTSRRTGQMKHGFPCDSRDVGEHVGHHFSRVPLSPLAGS